MFQITLYYWILVTNPEGNLGQLNNYCMVCGIILNDSYNHKFDSLNHIRKLEIFKSATHLGVQLGLPKGPLKPNPLTNKHYLLEFLWPWKLHLRDS